MKKTLTAAFAIAGLAGMAMATIETPAAGYADFTGTSSAQYVCNPFTSFTNSAPTLGDIDGSALSSTDYIKVIDNAGNLVFRATWTTVGGVTGWYDTNDALRNGYALARGNAIQFYGPSAAKLVIAGYIGAANTFTLTANVQNWIGNTSPLAKTVGNIVPSSFNTRKDAAYFVNPSTGTLTQAAYINATQAAKAGVSAGWYQKADIASQAALQAATSIDNWAIPSGQGFLLMPGTSGVTVTIPAY